MVIVELLCRKSPLRLNFQMQHGSVKLGRMIWLDRDLSIFMLVKDLFLYILLTMDEKTQIIYMQTRLTRLAAERWNMSLPQVASLFEEMGVYHYIAKMRDLFHIEGDLAVLDDVKQYLGANGATCG